MTIGRAPDRHGGRRITHVHYLDASTRRITHYRNASITSVRSRNDGVGAVAQHKRRDSKCPAQCREPILSIGRAPDRHGGRRITDVHYLDAVVRVGRNDGVGAVAPLERRYIGCPAQCREPALTIGSRTRRDQPDFLVAVAAAFLRHDSRDHQETSEHCRPHRACDRHSPLLLCSSLFLSLGSLCSLSLNSLSLSLSLSLSRALPPSLPPSLSRGPSSWITSPAHCQHTLPENPCAPPSPLSSSAPTLRTLFPSPHGLTFATTTRVR